MLLDIGFSHRESVFIIYAIQIVLVVSAFLMRYATDLLLLSIYLIFCILLLSMITLASRRDDASSGWVAGSQRLLQIMGLGSGLGRFRKFAYYIMRLLFSSILILGVVCIDNIPNDFGVLAILLLVIRRAADYYPWISTIPVLRQVSRFARTHAVPYALPISVGALWIAPTIFA
jgi:UDP-GlcNAc:undecaprenyl-phosphate GlcNAc-1-phosphate transferase